MKTYIKALILLLSVIAVSCNKDRLDTPPTGNTESAFFETTLQFRQNLVIVYAKLYDFYFYNASGGCPSSLWLLPGDDLTETQGARLSEELFDASLNPNNPRVTYYFTHLYQLIARANVLIEKTETVDFSGYDNKDEIPMMEGEALFLRAYAYFNLFTTYGSVPLIIQRIQSQAESNTPKSDKMDVLNQVIADATQAISLLPPSWPTEYNGRATKNSARALLMKAQVFKGDFESNNLSDFTDALTTFSQIDVQLDTSYLANFDAFNENNQESLFEVQASTPTAIDNIFLYNDGPWRGVECMSIFRGPQQVDGTFAANLGPTKYIITDKLLNAYGTDPRIAVFLKADDGLGGKLFQKYTVAGTDDLTVPFQNSANNERVLRYADMKLLAAEADLKTGNAPGAIQQINDLRKRARDWALAAGIGDGTEPADRSVSETNEATIMQWIMDERFIELAGEGHRWDDLRRWHAAGDINLTGWDGTIQYFSTALNSQSQFNVSKNLLFPFPQTEIDRNSAITENNPGY